MAFTYQYATKILYRFSSRFVKTHNNTPQIFGIGEYVSYFTGESYSCFLRDSSLSNFIYGDNFCVFTQFSSANMVVLMTKAKEVVKNSCLFLQNCKNNKQNYLRFIIPSHSTKRSSLTMRVRKGRRCSEGMRRVWSSSTGCDSLSPRCSSTISR